MNDLLGFALLTIAFCVWAYWPRMSEWQDRKKHHHASEREDTNDRT